MTDSPAENGVFWNESKVHLHHVDGSVDEFEDFAEDGDEKELYADVDDVFRDLVTDIAADSPPQPGDCLIVTSRPASSNGPMLNSKIFPPGQPT
ncbi:hypothetical protein [Streptomyces albogriseolus]|uniref:hypothetical protein n=1 Tax=Streptomyces albogriseolus TaxID=1887 RepID=UPI0033A4DBD9